MNFFNQRDSFGHSNYQSGLRMNTSSYSEEQTGAKRKKSKWSRNRGGYNGAKRNMNIDTPLFKEPMERSPLRSPQGNPSRYSHQTYRENPFRSAAMRGSGPKPQPYFKMSDMPNFVEPQHSGTPWNWENYFGECKNWQDKHKLAYYRSRCMALEFENQMLFEQINSLMEENTVFAAERGEMPAMRLPDISTRHGGQSEQGGQARNNQTPPPKRQGKNRTKTSSSSDTEFEYEITEDMMNYLEENIRHKLILNRKRNQDEKQTVELQVKKKEEESKVPVRKGPVGLQRREELEQLYGKNATVIQGLETAVQLNFNRNCTIHNPQMWMAVPLNQQTIVN